MFVNAVSYGGGRCRGTCSYQVGDRVDHDWLGVTADLSRGSRDVRAYQRLNCNHRLGDMETDLQVNINMESWCTLHAFDNV